MLFVRLVQPVKEIALAGVFYDSAPFLQHPIS